MRRSPFRALSAPLLLFVAQAAWGEGSAEYLHSHDWPSEAHGFGGFSGLEIEADGEHFTAISDRGAVITGRLVREDGRIVDVDAAPVQPLPDTAGAMQAEHVHDAEGLAIRPGGWTFVSYENQHRVWAFPTYDKAVWRPRADAFAALPSNGGLEALAIDDTGRLYAIPERSGRITSPFPVWRLDGRKWTQPFALSRSGGFLVTGADFGPKGKLYVLERAFMGFGFRSRVRRFTLGDDKIIAEETLFESDMREHDNLEGIAVWQDDTGAIRLTMISDDNFNRFQRTEFVEYRLSGEHALAKLGTHR